jgi:hypothetical protein
MSTSQLRGQTATAATANAGGRDLESRPSSTTSSTTRDNKKFGIIKRWASRRFANSRVGNTNNNHHYHHHQEQQRRHESQLSQAQQQQQHHSSNGNNALTTMSPTTSSLMVTTTSSRPSVQTKVAVATSSSVKSPLRRYIHSHNKNKRNQNTMMTDLQIMESSSSSATAATTTTTTLSAAVNVMTWLEDDCPSEILPLILSYAGPQMTSTLSQINHFWYNTIQDDSTWRVMCEELYKVR